MAERALDGELGASTMDSMRGYGGKVSCYSVAAGVDLKCSLESWAVCS